MDIIKEVYCDRCQGSFEPQQKEVLAVEDGKELFGEPIKIRAFACPHCGKIYVCSVMTVSMHNELECGSVRYSRRKQIESREKYMRETYIRELQRHGNGAELNTERNRDGK